MTPPQPRSTRFPYTTLFRSASIQGAIDAANPGDLIIVDPAVHQELLHRRVDDDQVSRVRSEEHTSELQSRGHLVCRLLLEKKKKRRKNIHHRHHWVR